MTNHASLIERLRGGLIVSCQALPGEPLHGASHMAAMSVAAEAGGAAAIRANGPADITAIHAVVDLPVIGLFKEDFPPSEVRITPTFSHAEQIAGAGAYIIALDATPRTRPGELPLNTLMARIHSQLNLPILADVSTFDEGMAAAHLGADIVATTLSGYTPYSPQLPGPDFDLLARLVAALRPLEIPVIAEGRIATPADAAHALALGAHAVVVGSAITRPQWITAQFHAALTETRLA